MKGIPNKQWENRKADFNLFGRSILVYNSLSQSVDTSNIISLIRGDAPNTPHTHYHALFVGIFSGDKYPRLFAYELNENLEQINRGVTPIMPIMIHLHEIYDVRWGAFGKIETDISLFDSYSRILSSEPVYW